MRYLLVLALASLATTTQVVADHWSDCKGVGGPKCCGVAYSSAAERAIAACTQIISSGGQGKVQLAEAYLSRGNAHVDKANTSQVVQLPEFELAIADYNEAIRLNSNHAIAFNNRGAMYAAKREYDRAIADYSEAIRLDPNYAVAHRNRAFSYSRKGDYDAALADYSEVIRLSPTYEAIIDRGLTFEHKRDYKSAIADFTAAILLEPSRANGLYWRAEAYNEMGEIDKALADYRAIVKLQLSVDAKENRLKYWAEGKIYSLTEGREKILRRSRENNRAIGW
jgi:tetratricopeptide (TPR) repeat protein